MFIILVWQSINERVIHYIYHQLKQLQLKKNRVILLYPKKCLWNYYKTIER
jgi:hypothetical protein